MDPAAVAYVGLDAVDNADLGLGSAPAGPETRSLALGMTTAAILLETGADPGGVTWWEPNHEYFDMFVQ